MVIFNGTSKTSTKTMKEEIRYAIWKAYGMKCLYSGHLIENYSDLEIDHILPKSMCKSKYKDYLLESDYDIENDLENLAPATRRSNSFLKRNQLFDPPQALFYREIAKQKSIAIENERRKFRKLMHKAENEAIRLELKEELDQNLKLRNTFYKFTVSEEFNSREDIFMSDHFWKSTEQIALNALIPSRFESRGSCVIEFNNFEAMISLTHPQILEMITYLKDDSIEEYIRRGISRDQSQVFVVLFSNAFHIPNQVFNDLVAILNTFLEHYTSGIQKFKSFIKVDNFPANKDKTGYIVLTANRDHWRRLIEYSEKFDNLKGDSSEHLFHFNSQLNRYI